MDWIYSTKRTTTQSCGWNLQRLRQSRNKWGLLASDELNWPDLQQVDPVTRRVHSSRASSSRDVIGCSGTRTVVAPSVRACVVLWTFLSESICSKVRELQSSSVQFRDIARYFLCICSTAWEFVGPIWQIDINGFAPSEDSRKHINSWWVICIKIRGPLWGVVP